MRQDAPRIAYAYVDVAVVRPYSKLNTHPQSVEQQDLIFPPGPYDQIRPARGA